LVCVCCFASICASCHVYLPKMMSETHTIFLRPVRTSDLSEFSRPNDIKNSDFGGCCKFGYPPYFRSGNIDVRQSGWGRTVISCLP
jgi:hypothetical protein